MELLQYSIKTFKHSSDINYYKTKSPINAVLGYVIDRNGHKGLTYKIENDKIIYGRSSALSKEELNE